MISIQRRHYGIAGGLLVVVLIVGGVVLLAEQSHEWNTPKAPEGEPFFFM